VTLARGTAKSSGEETPAELRKRARALVAKLKEAYPDARCALDHESPLQLLVATILSAQCTDARVNKVTPALFARYPTAKDLAASDRSELEELVRTTGFFRNKAKSIHGAASRIESEFGGEVPKTMAELLTLPGVARKTANVVLGTAFGIADGFVVDTHVFRLTHRMGLVSAKTPEQVERQLMELIPREDWIGLAHILIHHGRRVCTARGPDCEHCVVASLCPKLGVLAEAKPARVPKTPSKSAPPLKERIAASRRKAAKRKAAKTK
jgi:endonuclease-3